jgi:hypothetical protein
LATSSLGAVALVVGELLDRALVALVKQEEFAVCQHLIDELAEGSAAELKRQIGSAPTSTKASSNASGRCRCGGPPSSSDARSRTR